MGLGWPESWAGCQPAGQVQVRSQEVGRRVRGACEKSNTVGGSLGAWLRGWSRLVDTGWCWRQGQRDQRGAGSLHAGSQPLSDPNTACSVTAGAG